MTESLTLTGAARSFGSTATARLLGPVVAALLVLRLAVGDWTWTDAIIAAAILAAEPFTEWLIHVYLLHFRPRTIRGRTVDPLIARKHREHHADPKDLDLVLIPSPVLGFALAVGLVVPLLIARDVSEAATASLVSLAMLLTYEWTHFLIHTTYRPRHRLYRGLWRAHRWHHYRNENYWFGVTVHLGDRILRTYPDRDAVPLSPTARALSAAP